VRFQVRLGANRDGYDTVEWLARQTFSNEECGCQKRSNVGASVLIDSLKSVELISPAGSLSWPFARIDIRRPLSRPGSLAHAIAARAATPACSRIQGPARVCWQ